MIVEDSMLGRALWAIPLILTFQAGSLIDKIRAKAPAETLKIKKRTLK